jgi:hypothetical protein
MVEDMMMVLLWLKKDYEDGVGRYNARTAKPAASQVVVMMGSMGSMGLLKG